MITRHIFKILLLSLVFIPSGLAPFTGTSALTLIFVFGYWRIAAFVLLLFAIELFPSTYNTLINGGISLQVASNAILGYVLPSNVYLDMGDPDPLAYHNPLIPAFMQSLIYTAENAQRMSLKINLADGAASFAYMAINPAYAWIPAAVISLLVIPTGLLIGIVIHRSRFAKRVMVRIPQYLLNRS